LHYTRTYKSAFGKYRSRIRIYLAGDDTVTAIYDRHECITEKRQALTRWDQKLQQIIAGEKNAKIFKMGCDDE